MVNLNNKYTLYVHINKTNRKMYFGITTQSVTRRWNNGHGYDRCPLFHRAIEKYGWDGFFHIILLENLSKDFACTCEKYFIRKYSTIDPAKGYNCDNGGVGAGSHSEQTKEKLRAANIGKRYSAETRQKHCEASQRRKICFNDTARSNARASRMVSICQYNENRQLIKVWNSVTEAAKALRLNHQNISRCLNGKSHTCGGFYWSYLDGQIVEPINNASIVLMIDPVSKQVVSSFQSLDDAAKQTGISKGNICAAYNGRRRTAGGFVWRKNDSHK